MREREALNRRVKVPHIDLWSEGIIISSRVVQYLIESTILKMILCRILRGVYPYCLMLCILDECSVLRVSGSKPK